MTIEQLDNLKEQYAKATQGEWTECFGDYNGEIVVNKDLQWRSSEQHDRDAAFIVAIVNAFPEIVKELERLQKIAEVAELPVTAFGVSVLEENERAHKRLEQVQSEARAGRALAEAVENMHVDVPEPAIMGWRLMDRKWVQRQEEALETYRESIKGV